ncbi:hypothetical protein [Ideonella sp. BN130291]|uniref:hypothetical protein n=1 Tax=Ideonella sp. BN130291 TaxID=3112940 RepID=UPI002E255BBF|nr:hypothetical protein [Ideonella sp. BN130291]
MQILLPWQPDGDQALQRQRFAHERNQLVQRFGGLTSFSRAPAKGLWRDDESGAVVPDDIVVLEVMTPTLDKAWWASHRAELEQRFEQDEIVVRAHLVEQL